MKKRICSLILFMAVCLSACGGNVKNVRTHEVASERYSQEDIKAAVSVIMEEFDAGWRGCTLTEIYYAGDDVSRSYQEWADRNQADEVIVLLSSFDVDASGGDGSLNANSTYDGWKWILVRTDGGEWKHMDHGY